MRAVTRIAVGATLGARMAYGAAMIAAPEWVGHRWLGRPAREPGGHVALRAIGGREIAVHGVALMQLLRGEPVWPWLVASIAGDATDVISTIAVGGQLPDGAVGATLAAGGGSALLTGALLALVTLDDD